MPPKLSVVMLAFARIGAIHSIAFAGFSALASCIQDCGAKMIICSDGEITEKLNKGF